MIDARRGYVSGRLALAPALLLGLLCSSSTATAQQVRLKVDNDLFGLRGAGAPPDHDYTSGLHLSFISRGELQLAVGQRIYTPRRDGPEPVEGERSYAGWLYGEVGWRRAPTGGRSLRSLSLEIGVVGPSARGEEVQNGIHAWTGSARQEGWEHQLRLGPTVRLSYRDGLRYAFDPAEAWRVEPYAEAFAGTVQTGLEVAAPVLFGARPSLVPAGPGFGASLTPKIRVMIHDALLDRSPAGVPSVRRNPLVLGATLAVGYWIGSWSAAYSFTVQSREYESQGASHRWGSVTVAWSGDRRAHPREDDPR